MSFIQDKWRSGSERAAELHAKHVNPQFPEVLRIIGFDKKYARAEGTVLWDDQGRDYLDFLGGYSVCSLGHNPPELLAALKETLDSCWPNLIHMDSPPLSGQYAYELTRCDPTGRLEHAYFGSSGAEAVEAALKFARAATGRPRLLSFEGGFHGLSMGALSVCGGGDWQERFGPFLPGCARVPFGDLDALEKELSAKDVAALIAEPVQGEGGVRELSREAWAEVQRLCRKYGALLILDEIQTGFGRTGKFFAFEHFGLEPDIVCLAKAITNGMVPASATLGTREVFGKVFNRLDRCVVHSSTFGENNLAMAAALTVLDRIQRQSLAARAERMGALAVGRLGEALKDFELVKEVRGRGLMFAVEFGAPKSLTLKTGWHMVQAANKGLFGQMVTTSLLSEHRILTQVAGHNLNVLKLSPPLTLSEAELDRFILALVEVMKECHRFPGGLWNFGLGLAKRALGASSSA